MPCRRTSDFDQRKGARYPLVLLLDAEYSFPIAQAMWTHLRERSNLPDLVLVAIGYDVANYKLNRARDYTPTHVPTGGYGPDFQKVSGGGPMFLEFITKELVPWAAAHYRAEPKPILVGHSYGAFFAIYAVLVEAGFLPGHHRRQPVALVSCARGAQEREARTAEDLCGGRIAWRIR